MPKPIAPLTAARQWASTHPALEAHIFVRRWGTRSRLWTEYFAKAGQVETFHRSGVCRNCGHVYFDRHAFQEHCPACSSAGALGCTYDMGAAAYLVEIDICGDAPRVLNTIPRGEPLAQAA